jgi:hypothetical protein
MPAWRNAENQPPTNGIAGIASGQPLGHRRPAKVDEAGQILEVHVRTSRIANVISRFALRPAGHFP